MHSFVPGSQQPVDAQGADPSVQQGSPVNPHCGSVVWPVQA
jgi:hypothetical protein